MHVAGPQGAPLQVAELIENEKRVIAGAAEVTVVGCAFLIAMGRADAAVDIEHDRLGRTPLVQAVDPSPGEIRQCGEVPVGGQKFGLEAPHLTGRGSGPGHGATANYPTHCRISTQTVGVVHVFVATKATEDRLPEQSGHCMLAVLARAHLNQFVTDHAGQTKSVVEFPVGKQTCVRRDPGTVELQLQATVESQPQRLVHGFTLRVRHQPRLQVGPTH